MTTHSSESTLVITGQAVFKQAMPLEEFAQHITPLAKHLGISADDAINGALIRLEHHNGLGLEPGAQRGLVGFEMAFMFHVPDQSDDTLAPVDALASEIHRFLESISLTAKPAQFKILQDGPGANCSTVAALWAGDKEEVRRLQDELNKEEGFEQIELDDEDEQPSRRALRTRHAG